MILNGLLATWIPFFLTLTSCSPTSLGVKEIPVKEEEEEEEMSNLTCPQGDIALVLPRCLFGSFLSRQGSSLPDGALILAVRELKSVSVIFRDTSADVPTFSCDVLVMVSSP